MTEPTLSAGMVDLIDAAVPLVAGSAVHAVRRQRDKVVAATQGSYQALFDPALSGPPLIERLLVAHAIARSAGSVALQAHYRARLDALAPLTATQQSAADGAAIESLGVDPRLQATLAFTRTLTDDPVDGDRDALLTLPAAGLSTPDVVALAQLIAFVAYQVRVVAGLGALTALDTEQGDGALPGVAVVAADAAPFVHPANLPPPGEPLRINGYTSETLGWKAWLPTLDLTQASAEQVRVLDSSHPKARSSDYYLLLVQQPRILEERATVFNAIMYAPGGLSRAERELASAVVSRINGCVYCASVHAQRFEQLARRNDVIAQVFTDPETAGTTARERAIVALSIALTRDPAGFGAGQLRDARAAGLTNLEILDALHAVAIFAWANRLMLNLGEPVFPARG